MAAIEKVYVNYKDAKEFLVWVDKHDKEFAEEFKESKCPSLLEFFYFNNNNIEEYFTNKDDENEVHPICNIPETVERWIMRFEDFPEGAMKEMRFNYGLETEEEFKKFISEPIETFDDRPVGKHCKIISRTEYFVGRNYGNITFDDYNYQYYVRNKFVDEENLNEYTKSLINDRYWRCNDVNCIENYKFRSKKTIWTSITSRLERLNTCSIKSVIRQILKAKCFPVGTILRITDWHYYGEIIIKITK